MKMKGTMKAAMPSLKAVSYTHLLHNVVGAMLLAEYGYTYDDITKWGGAHTAVSANDRVGMFQDGTLNAYLTLGPGQQSHLSLIHILYVNCTCHRL